jgi:hypothetical protein
MDLPSAKATCLAFQVPGEAAGDWSWKQRIRSNCQKTKTSVTWRRRYLFYFARHSHGYTIVLLRSLTDMTKR